MENITREPSENQINEISKKESKKIVRPVTSTMKKTFVDVNPLKSTDSKLESIINEETEVIKNKNKNNSIKESKDEIPEKKGKENIYNKTMNSLAQNYPPLTANNIYKKANSSNKKNVKYFVKQNKENNANKGNRAFSGIKTDDTKTFENLFNNLKSYIPKNDINMEGKSLLKMKK